MTTGTSFETRRRTTILGLGRGSALGSGDGRRAGRTPGWHAEGDVWTHTRMVVRRAADGSPSGRRSTPHERTMLIFTALFHDAGKPLTSQVDPATGRITLAEARRRGGASGPVGAAGPRAATSRPARRSPGLVRFHGRPAFLLEKPDPAHEVVSLSWLVSNRLLYLFALADTRGRTTAEMGRPEENLHSGSSSPRRTAASTGPTRSPTTTPGSCSTAQKLLQPALRRRARTTAAR